MCFLFWPICHLSVLCHAIVHSIRNKSKTEPIMFRCLRKKTLEKRKAKPWSLSPASVLTHGPMGHASVHDAMVCMSSPHPSFLSFSILSFFLSYFPFLSLSFLITFLFLHIPLFSLSFISLYYSTPLLLPFSFDSYLSVTLHSILQSILPSPPPLDLL